MHNRSISMLALASALGSGYSFETPAPQRIRGPVPASFKNMPRQHSSKYRRHQGGQECARRVRQSVQHKINRFLA